MPANPNPPRRFAQALTRTRAGRAGMTAALVAGGLLALDLLGFVATVYFGPELLQAAETAGVAGLLPK